ncbi:hypothetical protein [Allorhodopirellula heiligendammensis]|uniref:Large cysteine-rich periplasmic protein OmcB n=1 Tax=Allorhodopirellula heiligendammensis TaxID=2714739 RepID=A0A5C6C2X0_9BACT|nr:hypothetical protein [Allorhodopirellula heiligendammensis]TWU18468.1 hypothetical protein Poly21_06310 [Allorhodopirellula heiligendammensis]
MYFTTIIDDLRDQQRVSARLLRGLSWSIVAIILACGGCTHLRLPAIDGTGSCLFAPLPTTTQLVSPCTNGPCCLNPCRCLGCIKNLGCCLSCPGFDFPNPAFEDPADPPPCAQPGAATGSGVVDNEPCVPGPDCSGECLVGPPAVLYGSELDAKHACTLPSRGKRGCILLSPQKIVAPVGGEVMFLSGICGTDGYLQVAEPLEWMLSRDSVGNIIAVDDNAPGLLHKLASVPVAKKQDGSYARGVTSTKEMLITRGNTNPNDDVKLEKGQTWMTLSSSSEGTSHVTVLAPESECWDQRKASATIYWVDARWVFPAPQRLTAGVAAELLTRVTRAEGSMPARGWKVRYENMNPELASFAGTDGSSVVEVNVDDSGNAPATLVPIPGTAGNAVVDVRVIRPGGTADNMPDLTLGRGQAFVTWSAPQLTLRTGGPEVASYNTPFDVFANIANPGDQDATGIEVRAAIPDGVKVISSDTFAKVFPNSVVWQIGTIPPQQQLDLGLKLSSGAPVSIDFEARGDGGLSANGNIRVDIFRPALALRVAAAQDRYETGQKVAFEIEVENTGDRPLRDVSLTASGDQYMMHSEKGSREVGNDKIDGPLQPGEIWRSTVHFTPTDSGLRCVTFQANAAGGQQQSQSSCVTVINPAPPTPALSVTVSAARDRLSVGDNVFVRGRVENTGSIPLKSVRVTMSYDAQLLPQQATVDFPRNLDTPYLITWTIPELPAGETAVLEAEFAAQQTSAASQFIFTAESAEGARGRNSTSIQIFPGNAPNTPLVVPPVLPPARTPPAIPGGPGTPPPLPQAQAPPPSPSDRIDPGTLRLDVLQRDISPRVGDPIGYSIRLTNDTDQLDSVVQIAFDLPNGVAIERLTQTQSPELGRFTRGGNTIYFEEIRSIKPRESIDYELVLRSNQPQNFTLVIEAVSRNVPAGIAVSQPTEVAP